MNEIAEDTNHQLSLYIEDIELHGFLGFAKPRIKTLKASFDKKLQILNSTNGCGKTTFISELNLFPIEKSIFEDDGYKRVTFRTHEGRRYRVESNQKYTNLIDIETGDNLNPGGTKTQHLALIRQLFGITPFLWNAAMGNITFTSADKNTRRQWIEMISGIDFDYPFMVYKKITSELNSLKGAAKHINIQLTTEASKLLREEEIKELIEHKDIYSKLVKELLLSRDTSISTADKLKVERNIAEMERKAKDAQLSYNRLARFINPFSNVSTLESLREYHSELKSEVNSTTVSIDALVSKLEDRTALLRKLDTGKGIDIKKVEEEINYFTTIQNDARRYIKGAGKKELMKYLPTAESALGLVQELGLIGPELSDYVSIELGHSFTDFTPPFIKDKYDELVLERDQLAHNLKRAKYQQDVLKEQRSNLDEDHKVECPECSTSFSPNLNECTKLENQIDELTKRILSYEKRLKELEDPIQSYEVVGNLKELTYQWLVNRIDGEYSWYYTFLRRYVDDTSDLNDLIRSLVTDERFAYQLEVGLTSKAELLKLEELKKQHKVMSEFGDVAELDKEVHALEVEIANLRRKRDDLNTTIKEVVDVGTLYNKHYSLLNELKCNLETLADLREDYIKIVSNVALEAVENDLQVQLSSVTKKVNDNEILNNLITNLQGMLDNTQERIERIKVLEKAFSPSTGLIAEQLTGYVSAFAKQLSLVIAKLWGYPMTIYPCRIDGKKGMDYQFPFKVGAKPIPDVSKGSKSQVSVINLAVMLCTRISLGLNGLPLFLDEVGGGFDTVHNQKLGEFIRELLANYGCSNVFLVHHDAAVRNSLGPRDTIVFDSTQVIVEPGYNTHVEITYYKEKKNEDAVY